MTMLIVLCGSAGSGKTTISNMLTNKYNAIRYSFDDMGCYKYSELIPDVTHDLCSREMVIVDALYTRLAHRKTILEATAHIDCKRILIFMDTPLDECIRRNAQRPNPLPEFIVEDIYNSIEPPTIDEGWDEIIYVKEDETLELNFTSN